MELIKKYWQLLIGGLVTLFTILLVFRKKDGAIEVLEKTTESGNKSFENLVEKQSFLEEEVKSLEIQHKEKIKSLEEVYESNLKNMNSKVRKKIEKALKNGDEKRATQLLSNVTGIKNLD